MRHTRYLHSKLSEIIITLSIWFYYMLTDYLLIQSWIVRRNTPMSNFFMLEFTKLSQKRLFELRSFRAEVDSANGDSPEVKDVSPGCLMCLDI